MILSWLRGLVLIANPKNGTSKRTNRERIPRKLRYAAMIEQLEDRVVPAATNLFLNFAPTGMAENTVPVARSAAIPVFVDVGTLDSGNVGGSGGIQSADVYIKYDSAVLSINQTSDIKLGSLLTSVADTYSITPITNVPANVIAFTIAPNGANLYTGTMGGHLAELDFHVLPTIAVGNTTLLDLSASVPSPTRSTDVSDQNGAAYTLTPPLTNYAGTLTQAGALSSADFTPADDDPGDGAVQVVTTPTTTSVSTSNATPIYGTAVTLTATVAPASGTTVPPQGTVAFFINGTTPLGTGTFAGSDAANDALFTYVTTATQLQVAGGDAQPVTATYSAGDGFDNSSGTNTVTETVTPAPLTVTGITANGKMYDSTTAATLNTGSAALAGTVYSGDVVTLVTSGATGAFASKDVADNIAVTVSDLTLGGAQAGDYTLTQPTTTANITPAPLTVAGITASDKVYDSTTAATLNTSSGALAGTVFSGDVVTLVTGSATGAFASKDAANNITVAVAGLTLAGAQAGDYALTQPTTTANITPAPLTVTGITANNKVYDSTTTATLNTASATFVGLFTGDVVTLNTSGVTATFASKDVANGITVTVSGLTLGGAQAGDYTLAQPSATANITPAPLTVTGITASGKVYDSTTAATLNTGSAALAGTVFSGDVVTLVTSGATGAFASKDAANNIPVTVSGLTLGGAQAGDYTLTQPTMTASITPAPLTVTGVTANNKVYDSTTTATLNTDSASFVGLFSGDVVSLNTSGLTATFASKDVANAIAVAVSGLTLGGAQAVDYALTQPTTTANITPAPLAVMGITAGDKVYDSTTVATLNTGSAALAGTVFSGDVVTLVTGSATGAFAGKDAANNIPVTISGLTLGGDQAGDYMLTQPTTTANITPAPLTVTGITAGDKVYDSTTAATLTTGSAALAGTVFSGDVVTLVTSGAAGAFASKDVANNITVTVSGLTLGGAQAGDYALTQPTTTANITRAILTITALTNTKTYDTTPSAAALPSVAGLQGSDMVTGLTEAYNNANAGTGKTLLVTGYTVIDGNGGNDYTVSIVSTTSGVITPAPLTVTGITANNKVYDSTTNATLNTADAALAGVLTGDLVTLNTSGAIGTFGSKDVARIATVMVSGLTLGGAQASNYTLAQPTAFAAITPFALMVSSVTANDKVYDASTAATLNTGSAVLAGVFPGDMVTLQDATGTFSGKNAGNNITVAVTGLTLGGAQAGDYTPILNEPLPTANITPAPLTITATTNTKPFDGNTSAAAIPTVLGLQGTDTVTGLTEAYTDPSPGTGKTLVVTAYTVNDGNGGGNYAVSTVSNTTGVINNPTTQLVITSLSSNAITAGGAVTITVTAEDIDNNPVPDYRGTVNLTSTDSDALYNAASLPANYTFVASDHGSHTFTVTLITAGSQTITVVDQANSSLTAVTSPIAVSAGPFSKFAVSVLGGTTVVAGNPFIFTVQAVDQYGNAVTTYSGPTSVITTAGPADPLGNFPISGTLEVSSLGIGFFQGNLKTAGSYTLTTTAGAFTGTSGTITVTPASAGYFTVTAPAGATTGTPFNVTVKAFDTFGNVATGFTGAVSILTTDPSATPVTPYTFVGADNGVHTFSVTLNSSTLDRTGTSIIASNSGATISGLSAPVAVQGLVVTGFQPTATGFTVTFSKPFTPADLTMFGPTGTVQDVTLTGAGVANITGNLNVPGTLYLDPTTPNTVVFKATSAFLDWLNSNSATDNGNDTESTALPDGTYTVTLKSGTAGNGFVDALNTHLDGLGNGAVAGGTANNYVTTFTTTYQDDADNNAHPTAVLSIPDFARGPDGASTISVPNFKTTPGIPIVLYNAVGVTDATFTLTFNPQLLTPTAGATDDSTAAGSTFTMGTITSVDSTHATVSFTYHNATASSGTVVLGDITATVPDSAATLYKTKELLALSGITVTPTPSAPVLAADGIHVDAYLGDVHVTAGPTLNTADALDVSTKVSTSGYSGFAAYSLLDPVIIANVFAGVNDGLGGLGTVVVNGSDVTALFSKAAGIPVPAIPSIPAAVAAVSVSGADPTVSLLGAAQATNGIVTVPVMLDHPHPDGSTGMTEAHLALTYDPSVLSVSASDITLGSIPGLGAGWQITSEVDAATGQIGINLFNLARMPITATQAGSLVNIAFHIVPEALVSATSVQLVNQVVPNGQRIVTDVDDSQGPLTLSQGIDRLVLDTGVQAGLAWPGLRYSEAPAHGDVTAQGNTTNAAGASEYLSPGHDISHDISLDVLREISGETTAAILPLLTNGTRGETGHGIPADLVVTGALAFQSNQSSVAATQPAGQVFQIANAPLLSTLLSGNSPQQLADRIFLALARGTDALAVSEVSAFSLFQDNLLDVAAQHPDWLTLANRSPTSATAASAGTLTEIGAGQAVSGHFAVVDKVFAELADEFDDLEDSF